MNGDALKMQWNLLGGLTSGWAGVHALATDKSTTAALKRFFRRELVATCTGLFRIVAYLWSGRVPTRVVQNVASNRVTE
jgi:hypothetical protein